MEQLIEIREELRFWLTSSRRQTLHDIAYNSMFDSEDQLEEDKCKWADDNLYWWDYGADKFVFTLPTVEGWVFKMPFVRKKFKTTSVLKGDMCHTEAENYAKAMLQGVECFFAETQFLSFITPYNNNNELTPVYIAKDAENWTDAATVLPHSPEVRKAADKICREFIDKNKYQFYGEIPIGHLVECGFPKTKIESLLTFLFDCNINDLHSGNYKFTEDGLIIWDYSGFSA